MVGREINGIVFSARKVVMSRKYFVEAVTPHGEKRKIGPFRYRSRAEDWIERNASTWSPDDTELQFGLRH
jgi:hypothetical protein